MEDNQVGANSYSADESMLTRIESGDPAFIDSVVTEVFGKQTLQERFYIWCDWFFTSKLACRIDTHPYWLRWWWYGVTGRVGGFFHRQHCANCRNRLRNK
jgi:hypothetical protein